MSEQPLIVVVGGGVSGMATALAVLDLAAHRPAPAPRVLVLEAEDRVGGKIQTLRADGYLCEWGVNGFLNKEPRTLELCQRLGIADRLLPASGAFNKRYIYARGRLRQVHMHPLRFLFSGLLPWRAKLRLLREPWIPPRFASEADESVAQFGRRRVGPVAFQVLVDSMQTGIYAGDPEQMSVLSCFPRVVEVERDYGSLIRGMAQLARERKRGEPLPGAGPAGHLTSFRGGMQVLIDRMAEALQDRVRCDSPVRQVTREGGSLLVSGDGFDAPLRARAVVLACPAHAAALVTRELDPQLSAVLEEIPYPPMAVVCLGYPTARLRHPLDGFGFLVPRTEGLRILGALWASATFPDNAPEEHGLIRVMVGGARDQSVLDLDDDALVGLVRAEVDRVQGLDGPPSFARVFRHPLAIPQYVLGHEDRLRRMQARLDLIPGLHLTGNAYRGIGVNDCARNAWPTAEAVLGSLERFSIGLMS
jgi:oxygen-dependent protoporphyrinogen oxidase